MQKVLLIPAYLLTFLVFWSCEKDDPVPPDDTIGSFEDGVIISCEGGFGQGNAVVYYLDVQRSEYVPEIYSMVNQEPLGDVLQSIDFESNKAHLVVNGSGKIIQVDRETFVRSGSLEGLSSPTEMEIEDGVGYIGSLYSQHILVADMTAMTITDSIFIGEQSNFLHEEDNRLWILSQSEYQGRTKDHIYYANLTDHTVDSVAVGAHPIDWTYGEDGNLYVYCRGSENTDNPGIYVLDIDSQSLVGKVDVPASVDFFGKLAYDEVNERLLVHLSDGLYTLDAGAEQLNPTAIVDLTNVQYVYGLGVAPWNGDIYIGDARDFSSAGMVFIYSSDGAPKVSFSVGLGPNNFYFD